MINFFNELKRRNKLLFAFGFIQIFIAIFCLSFAIIEHKSILGANAFLKPFKYGLCIAIISWFFGWILAHLFSKKKITYSSWFHVITLFTVILIVIIQTFRGVPSHFNFSTPFDQLLTSILWFCYVCYTLMIFGVTLSFFMQKKMPTSQHFAWGIRMSLLVYLLFLYDGFYMMTIKSHLVSGEDSEKGLYFLNWNTKHGDLRIIHYTGIFALPTILLTSYYVLKKKKHIILFAISYFLIGLILYILTLFDIPLIPSF
jgi:hypothetical protein